MQAALRRQSSWQCDPVGGDELAGDLFLGGLEWIIGCKAPHQGSLRIEDLELHRPLGIPRQDVVDDSTCWRILTEWLVRRDRRIRPGALREAIGWRRAYQLDLFHGRACKLAQRGNVVENPYRPAVSGDNQVTVLDPKVPHRRVRQVDLQRCPVIPIVP